MAQIAGKQIKDDPDGLTTSKLNAGIISADAAGRALMATDVFDSATVTAKFATNAIALDRLAEAVLQADGGQVWTGNQDANSNKLVNLAAPTAANDAARKADVDAVASGVDWKNSVRVATDAALPTNTAAGSGIGKTLTADANGVLTVDGVATVLNDEILVKDESTGSDNGLYDVTTEGTAGVPFVLTRRTDADEDAEVTGGLAVWANEGTNNGDSGWILTTNDPITVDTTSLTFTQFTGLGQIIAGAGLTKTGNTLDVGAGLGITVNADDIEVIFGGVGGITTINAGDAASAGVANNSARGDHEHAVATAAPVGLGSANAEGTGTSLSRDDHVHARDVHNQENVTSEVITSSDTALADTLNNTPINDASVKLFLNGLLQRQGATFDYSITGSTITWLASSGTAVNMKTNDEILVVYRS